MARLIRRPHPPDRPLPPTAESEWQRLRRQLELADRFWLAFLFTPSPPAAARLRARMEAVLRARARSLRLIRPESPEALARVPHLLFDPESARHGWVWLESIRGDPPASPGAPPGPWTLAWEELLRRLNERRERMARHLRGGLVVAAPPGSRSACGKGLRTSGPSAPWCWRCRAGARRRPETRRPKTGRPSRWRGWSAGGSRWRRTAGGLCPRRRPLLESRPRWTIRPPFSAGPRVSSSVAIPGRPSRRRRRR